ncbi:1-deoxy-D-xylulose-5-phosphate reductoisomerase [Dethiosulfatarculus sandiegensis]|uniref:1-deoxy-D-xylulose-5-phosphate reductoisomerase n=1 Tax=Dethiosulfatarculus sandiegensis TaxID=1429043 RepID=UPI0005C856FB|nr:1-deoxy-D-xylulose-5-phosphate reductoisomerase [Dethiosulfatarculus sandiegensis]
MKRRLAILGSTGSIGRNTLDVVAKKSGMFEVVSLAAARSVELLAEQARLFEPEILAVLDEQAARALKKLLPANLKNKVVFGSAGYLEATLANDPDLVLSAMVGSAGLLPTYAAVEAGIDVALANKETLVAAGELVMAKAGEKGASLIPVDSEHSAIFQCLMGNHKNEVRHIWLTASGGPFRNYPADELAAVTAKQALKHPNWSMGPKITIDSATLMNKGLEVIEARWLFDTGFNEIKVVIHPQSMIHSLVEYVDGSFVAQMGPADMRIPIAFALGYPERLDWGLETLDLTAMSDLTFEEPDLTRFPALALAFEAGRAGGAAPAVLNGANEVAVASFLNGNLDFCGITACVQAVLESSGHNGADSVAEVLEADRWAREKASDWLKARGV